MDVSDPRTEQEIFDELAGLAARPGFIHVFTWISLRDNYISYDGVMDKEALAASYAAGRTVRTEFSTLLGLLIRQPIDFSEPTIAAAKALFERVNELLHELHECLGRPMWDSIRESLMQPPGAGSEKPPSPFTRADVLREPIFYGGESAYSFQYQDMAVERYAADEVWLSTNKGFTIAQAQIVARGISEIQSDKLAKARSRLSVDDPSFQTLLPAFSFTAEEISSQVDMPVEKTRAVLSALSVAAPANAAFTSLGAFNVANACPIIARPDDTFIALQTYGIVESLYDSPFYWMITDKSYRAAASKHRGAFTEQFVARKLRAVFGDATVHCNVNIEASSGRVSEMDVLVLFGDRAVIVQCKSKKMTLESRKGNDQTLRDDFQKAVQDAYDQGLLCARSLSQPDLEFVTEDGSKLSIPELREIYIICAVSDHYPVLTVQARNFLRYEQDAIIQAPLVADLFLIDVLTEMLSSPLRLLSYINRRVGYADRVFGTNELAILGYHLSQNLWLDDETGVAMIAEDCSLDLDTAMTVRRTNIPGTATPKGVLTRLRGTLVGRIVEQIEHEGKPDFIDLGFLLLTINDETIQQLEQGLKDVARRTRLDGKHHDFTLGFGNGDSGLTIHCNRLPAHDAVLKLTEYCERRKYAHRAKGWFGLIVSEADSMPKLSIALRYPWKHDPKLAGRTRGMVVSGTHGIVRPAANRRAPDRTKIGRNDPCPCGSGNKFKKCCLT